MEWLWDKNKNRKCGKLQRRTDHRFNQFGVLHTTENNIEGHASMVAHWQNRQTKVYSGYHYLIDSRGIVYQCNPLTTRANHAGKSYKFAGMFDGNYGIGASMLAEAGKMPYHDNQAYFDKLLNNTAQLLVDIEKQFGIPIRKVSINEYKQGKRGWLGHQEVAYRLNKYGKKVQRKYDPGDKFPWDVLISRAVSIQNQHKIPETRKEGNMKDHPSNGPSLLEETEHRLVEINARPTSIPYVLRFYREIAKQLNMSGAKPEEVATELLKRNLITGGDNNE